VPLAQPRPSFPLVGPPWYSCQAFLPSHTRRVRFAVAWLGASPTGFTVRRGSFLPCSSVTRALSKSLRICADREDADPSAPPNTCCSRPPSRCDFPSQRVPTILLLHTRVLVGRRLSATVGQAATLTHQALLPLRNATSTSSASSGAPARRQMRIARIRIAPPLRVQRASPVLARLTHGYCSPCPPVPVALHRCPMHAARSWRVPTAAMPTRPLRPTPAAADRPVGAIFHASVCRLLVAAHTALLVGRPAELLRWAALFLDSTSTRIIPAATATTRTPMSKAILPTYDAFMEPLLQSLRLLGGSGTIEETNAKIVELMGLSDEQLEVPHDPEHSARTEVEYRLAWARTYLKKYGVLENSSRGVWSLTAKGKELDHINPKAVKRFMSEQRRNSVPSPTSEPIDETSTQLSWREELMNVLLAMEPATFERLAQRLLRESGFIQVAVTGRTGDGGIDGKGIMRLGGLLSFHVIFQCKRYRGLVSASQVRDFRGAMVGRADKGLLITTGNFTKDAMREATRDGAPAIDLVDGDQLLDKLKELNLGVQTRKIEVEQIEIDKTWFTSI
jgi:restriction system protein